MPASLLASQFETLEPLEDDENGVAIDVDQNIDSIVDEYRFADRTGELMNSGITFLATTPPSSPSRWHPAGS